MKAMRLSRVRFDGLNRTYLMRATDALASATATYAIPLLVLVTTRSSSLTGLASGTVSGLLAEVSYIAVETLGAEGRSTAGGRRRG